MKSYILGYYASSDHLLDTLANKKRTRMLNALLDSHPVPMKVKEIASKGKINMKTVYGEPYLGRLKSDGFIREVEEQEEKGGGGESSRYNIENVNSLSRERRVNYSLAPGNVEYSEEFKSALNRLINQLEIKNECRILLGFVKFIVESVKESAPKKGNDYICSTCGLNHEARDFIRATLLYLLDQFEISSEYLEYLREQDYIDKEHYNEYYEIIQKKLGNRKSEGLKTETQFTHSKTNDEQIRAHATDHKQLMTEGQSTLRKSSEKQIVAELWFDGLRPLIKKMAEWILSKKPEISKEGLKDLTDRRKSKSHSRSELDAIHSVAEDLGVFLSEELVLAYYNRKREEAYEKRPEVAERRKERRRKRRAKSR
jgi:hypothetical protein